MWKSQINTFFRYITSTYVLSVLDYEDISSHVQSNVW